MALIQVTKIRFWVKSDNYYFFFFFHHLIDVFFLLIILQFHFLNYNFDFIHSFEAANIRSNVYAIK